MSRRHFAAASAAALACATSAHAEGPAPDDPQTLTGVVVTGERSVSALDHLPTTTESVTDVEAADTVSRVTVEDMLRYLPDVLIRQRHFGDTQDPITTRTSGVGASARSLIYADGVLLSALIGNNNGIASPKWGLVAPDAVSRIDVLYGPFAAAYPGNSIGAVVEITTKAPAGLEASAEVQGRGSSSGSTGTTRPMARAALRRASATGSGASASAPPTATSIPKANPSPTPPP